jgi:LysM repeat protein
MKQNFALAAGIFCAMSASSALANPELEAMRLHSEAQESRIRELESLLQKELPPQTPSQPSALASSEHTVQSGDTVEKIARLHGCRVSDLLGANGLKADSIIHPGQKLKLPAKDHAVSAAPAPTPTPATPQPAVATHTVVAGETFSSIARQHGIPLNDLLAANPEIKPTALRLGQTVRLGQASASPQKRSLDTGATHMILATKQDPSPSPSPLASPPTVKIQQIKIDREMTYHEFASRQGTNTRRLNQLNGLDLLDSALLAKGSELLAPAQP